MSTQRKLAERFTLPEGVGLKPLFDGWSRRSYDLPIELVKAGKAVVVITAGGAHLRARRDELRAIGSKHAHQRAVDGALFSTIDTGELPEDLVGPIVAARRAVEVADEEYEVIRELVPRSVSHLTGVTAIRDELVIEGLNTAFTETLAEVRRVEPYLRGLDLKEPSDGLAAAPPPTQDGYMVLVRARSRADDILRAARSVYIACRSGGLEPVRAWLDTQADPKNRGLISPNAFRAAGPEHGLERLVWLASDPAARPWVPSCREHDEHLAAWMELMATEERHRPVVATVGRAIR